MKKDEPIIIIEDCPICDRQMFEGPSIDKHHFVPKSQGGKGTEPELIHRVCHVKIHSLFTEKELALNYDTPEKLRENEDIQKFIKWVSKKDPDYYDRSKKSKTKYKINI